MKLKITLISLFLAGSVAAAPSPGDFLASGPQDSQKISLTFDDGPGPHTEAFLDLLDKYNVKATFFMQGSQVKRRPEIAKMVAERGHEIASHTTNHVNYKSHLKNLIEKMGDEAVAIEQAKKDLKKDMQETRNEIKAATGVDVNVLRMPHGIDRPWIKEVAKEEGVVLVNWTYGADWSRRPLGELVEGYRGAVRPGAILLYHDGGSNREKNLPMVEAALKEAAESNINVVPVGELIGLR